MTKEEVIRKTLDTVLWTRISSGGIKVSRYWSHMNSIRTNLNNWIDLYSFEKVTAWMPLPKPYSEVEE